ncbi:GNAT family N-acetyltransferase [Streptomyces sp. NPDC005820]|uniref:GNAT family N-acetyltransferase n=1 Tax=Streptomyces sp. NPDC005820 TaxID=3157069 RepID=UPI0034037C86
MLKRSREVHAEHAPQVPVRFGITGNTDDTSQAALLTAHGDAFEDQPGAARWSADDWQEMVVDKSQVRWDLSAVATSGDEVAAYLHTEEWPAGEAAAGTREGWIARLGSRRVHRGRGLATTLLVRALHACAADGLTAVGLEVDPRNPTDPLTIYLRTNFAVTARLTEYQLTED